MGVRPTELVKAISDRFTAGIKRGIYVKSGPGMGKTQIASQVAKALGVAFKAIHAPLLQPEDYGFPVISQDRKTVDFVVSTEKFPIVGADCPEKGIFLIDELPQADASAQKILANLVQEKEIHGKPIKPGWLIVATGNRVGDRAGANKLLTHLGNRVTHYDLDVHLDDWTVWALENGVKPEVIAFIRFRPALLNMFDPHADVSATPRSWVEGISSCLGVIDTSLEFESFRGDVGDGPAAEFLGFLKLYRKLPNPDAVIMNPTGYEVPTDAATQYAICGALSHRATKDNFDRLMQYIMRLPPEFSVLFVRDCMRLNPAGSANDITRADGFTKWAAKHGAKLLM